MPDVLAIHPGGGSRVYVNPNVTSSSETIITNNDNPAQAFVSPTSGSIIVSPDPIVINNDPGEIAFIQEQLAQALVAIATLQTEQAADVPVQRLEYTPSSPSSTWTITHNFGYIPSVELYIDGVETFTDINATNTTATLTFPSPQTGVAILT